MPSVCSGLKSSGEQPSAAVPATLEAICWWILRPSPLSGAIPRSVGSFWPLGLGPCWIQFYIIKSPVRNNYDHVKYSLNKEPEAVLVHSSESLFLLQREEH